MKRDLPAAEQRRPRLLLYTLYAVLTLITIRIIFRLIEYSQGLNSSIPRKEGFQYVFDSSMMLFSLILLNVVHPGRIMPGKECDFPSRKERKAAGKNNVRGRAGMVGSLPLYDTASSTNNSRELPSQNPTYPKIDNTTVSTGYVTEYGR